MVSCFCYFYVVIEKRVHVALNNLYKLNLFQSSESIYLVHYELFVNSLVALCSDMMTSM